MKRSTRWALVPVAVLATAVCPGGATAQIISTKTVPVAEGDQFRFLPSANLGMSGVSIALADSVLDPFVNPATASRLAASRFFGSPSFFSLGKRGGGATTLPAGVWLRSHSGSTFGALAAAVQVIDTGRSPEFLSTPVFAAENIATVVPTPTVPLDLSTRAQHVSRTNSFLFGSLGHAFETRGLSVAGSVFWSRLHQIDGVRSLYANSRSVRQQGGALDLRLGATKEWAGDRSLELLALHRRLQTTDDAQFSEVWWDPVLRSASVRLRTSSLP